MTGNVVSRRYAKALFAIGAAKGEADQAKYGEQLGCSERFHYGIRRSRGVLQESLILC